MFHENAFKRKKKEIKIVIQNDELKADETEEAHKPFLSKAAQRSRTDDSLDAAFFLF